jgi:hypothetical protein
MSTRLRVSLTIDPPSTLIIKKMSKIFIYFWCHSYWKCLLYHYDDFEISHRNEVLMIFNIAGKKNDGILIIFLLLETIIKTPPIIIRRIDRMFIDTNLNFFTFSDAPMHIHLMSEASCAQFTDI